MYPFIYMTRVSPQTFARKKVRLLRLTHAAKMTYAIFHKSISFNELYNYMITALFFLFFFLPRVGRRKIIGSDFINESYCD